MQDNMKLKMIKNIADGYNHLPLFTQSLHPLTPKYPFSPFPILNPFKRTIIWLKEKPSSSRPLSHLPSKPHPPSTTLPADSFAELTHNPKCQHGPQGKCLHCIPKEEKKEEKGKCMHGP